MYGRVRQQVENVFSTAKEKCEGTQWTRIAFPNDTDPTNCFTGWHTVRKALDTWSASVDLAVISDNCILLERQTFQQGTDSRALGSGSRAGHVSDIKQAIKPSPRPGWVTLPDSAASAAKGYHHRRQKSWLLKYIKERMTQRYMQLIGIIRLSTTRETQLAISPRTRSCCQVLV